MSPTEQATVDLAVKAYQRYATGAHTGPKAWDIIDRIAVSERHWQQLADMVVDAAMVGFEERTCPRCDQPHYGQFHTCDTCREKQKLEKRRLRMRRKMARGAA